MYNTITTNITRFSSESLANAFIRETAKTKSQRISNFGYDADNTEPYWVETQHLVTFECCTQEQLDRWKACGKFDHD